MHAALRAHGLDRRQREEVCAALGGPDELNDGRLDQAPACWPVEPELWPRVVLRRETWTGGRTNWRRTPGPVCGSTTATGSAAHCS
jgi:hypothetical protein